MKRFLAIAFLLGTLIVLGSMFCTSRNVERTDFESSPFVQETEKEQAVNMNEPPSPPVETTTKEEVSLLLSKTGFAKKYSIPGRKGFAPGPRISKVLFAKNILDPVPETETDADWFLCLDNTTGEIVADPNETWTPLNDEEIIDAALSDIEDEETKNYHRTLKTEVEQVPGLAVVTFRGKPSHETEYGYVLAPDFILRVWINTRTKTVYCGEVGN